MRIVSSVAALLPRLGSKIDVQVLCNICSGDSLCFQLAIALIGHRHTVE